MSPSAFYTNSFLDQVALYIRLVWLFDCFLLSPATLQNLSSHLERAISSVQQRWQAVSTLLSPFIQHTCTATNISAQQLQVADLSTHSDFRTVDEDAEIARYKSMIQQIDELELEFQKLRMIGAVVKGIQARVQNLNRLLRF
jgi:hypothetical protein